MKIYNSSLQGVRPTNEDKHNIIVNNNIKLFGVYDGHGGTYVSEFLEKYIPEFYCSSKLKPPFNEKFHYEVFDFIQKKVLSNKKGFGAGSTCCLAMMYKDENGEDIINVVNVGDSRACIVKKNKKVKQVTVDHKPDNLKEKERIEKSGGEIYMDTEGIPRVGDLSLSRAIGDGDQLPHITHRPDTKIIKNIKKIKYLVIGCDGLWDVVLNDEIGDLIDEFLKKTNNPNPAKDLAELAIKRGSGDNVSVIIVDLWN